MFDLAVKKVPFCGTELLAVKEKESGKIYAGINLMLKDMGFNDYQIRYRREKWMEDKSLSKGVRKFSHPSENGVAQESYCIDIMKLPLAIAKLEITPKMEIEMPELAEKLERYQDECADVLAAAFLPQEQAPVTYQYALSAATFDSVANLGRLIERIMKAEGACPHEIAQVMRPILQQAGIDIRDCFVKLPAYEQLMLSGLNY